MKIKSLILTFFLILCTVNAKAKNPSIGAPAPDFKAITYDGKEINLAQYKGRHVVLEWYSSICPCINGHYETGNMQTLQKEFQDQGVIWLTVSSHAKGSKGSLNRSLVKSKLFKQYKAAPTTVVLDHEGVMGTDYGATSTPHVFLINPEGVLIYKGALDNKVAEGETYNPLTSKNFLKEALKQSQKGQAVTVSATQPYGCDINYPMNEYTLKN